MNPDVHSSSACPRTHSTTTAKAALARKLQSNTNPKLSYAGSVANSPALAPPAAGGNKVRSCMSVESRYMPCYTPAPHARC